MADGFNVDFSELDVLAADLDRAVEGIEPFLVSAIKFTSVRVKRSAQAKVRRRKFFKGGARAINFELKKFRGFGASVIQSEIGYDKDKGGAIGSLAEFGAPGSPNALAPGNELQRSLHEEEADFQKGVERALDDALKKAGL